MFQLIVAVVAIALVVIMALAMIFYGGSAFTTGQEKALYAQLMNHGSQIEGAMKLYQSDKGVFPTGTSQQQLQTLVNGGTGTQSYLSDVPLGSWYIQNGTIYRQLTDVGQCKRINAVAGKDVDSTPSDIDGCPPCTGDAGGVWESYRDWPGCRTDTITN